MSEWIQGKLPPSKADVLVYTDWEAVTLGWYSDEDKSWYTTDNIKLHEGEVTHWMFLPDKPKQ